MPYTARLDKIISRTRQLSNKALASEAALKMARDENQKLKLEIDNQARIIEDLNNRIKIIKLAQSFDGGEDIAALKRKINEYIREIDNSIALLND
jgi:predicted RNase H-like nuclease (RuvC/YqgF family)